MRLREDGFDPWLDEERLLPGQDWELEISTAVRQCDAVIVCLSAASVEKTGYVQKELRRVLDVAEYQPEGRIFVIPVRLEACRVPESLRPWHHADLFLENGYESLRAGLRARAGLAGSAMPDRVLTAPEQRPGKTRRRRWIPLAAGILIAASAGLPLAWWYLDRNRTEPAVHMGDLQVFTTPGAEVSVDGKGFGLADARGVLVIHGLTTTEHAIRAHRASFMDRQGMVDVAGEMLNSVTLELRPTELINEGSAVSAPEFRLARRLSGQSSDLNGMYFLDQKQLVTYGSGVVLWDAQQGRQISAMQTEDRIFCVSPDLQWLAIRIRVNYTDTARVVNARTGQIVRQFTGYAITFTPDSKQVVIEGEPAWERTAEFWDIASGTKRATWKDHTIGLVKFSPDGRWIVTAATGVTVRDRKTQAIARQFPTKNESVPAVAFSADGRWLAAVRGRTIDLWELATGRQGPTVEIPQPERGATVSFGNAAFMPDSRQIITSNGNAVQVWDAATGHELRQWPVKNCGQLAISTNGQRLAVNGENLTIWERH